MAKTKSSSSKKAKKTKRSGRPGGKKKSSTVAVSKKELARLVNTLVEKYTGMTLEKGKGKYQAVCDRAHGFLTNSWFGPCRPNQGQAQQDANAHNKANPGHHAFPLGPVICSDPAT